MFKWVKKVINKSSNDLNDEGLQNDLNDLYIAYDKILSDKRFDSYLGRSHRHLIGLEIKWIISDTIKLTDDHPELLLHLGNLNEYVFRLKMATTTLLDIYDNKDNLAQDVYKQQTNDAKEVIVQLVQCISDSNKTLAGLYQDENSSTINFLKKQMGMVVDDPQGEYEKFYNWLIDEKYPRQNAVIKYLLLGVQKGYYTADNLESTLSNNPKASDLEYLVNYLISTDSTNELRIKLRDRDYDEIVNF